MTHDTMTPSTLIVPLFGEEAPDEALVVRRLTDIFPQWGRERPDPQLLEQAGLDDGLEWLIVARIPGLEQPVFIWPEELDEPPEEAWWTATDVTEDEREAFEECLWGVVVETTLHGIDGREGFRRQLQVALGISEDADLFYDDTSLRFITRERAESLVELPSLPAAQELYSLHAVFDVRDENLLWMHTHGLDRAGVPDLEIFHVPGSLRTTAAQLLALVAERLLDGVLNLGDAVEIGPDLPLKLVELEQAVELLDPGELGSELERDEPHWGLRAALVAVQQARGGFSFFAPEIRSVRMDGFLKALEQRDVLLQTRAEVARRQDLARFRWVQFLSLWRQRAQQPWRFLVCAPIPTPDPELPQEHLWFEVQDLEEGSLGGRLINAPMVLEDLHLGDSVSLSFELVCDWSIATEDGVFTPANVVQLARRSGITIPTPKPVH